MNEEAIGECDEPRMNLDPRNAIAEMIDIGAHREVGIAVDLVRREQVRITRWMDAELKGASASEPSIQMLCRTLLQSAFSDPHGAVEGGQKVRGAQPWRAKLFGTQTYAASFCSWKH
jgi:hypothetical protein